jgi:hypothetical protein
MKLISFLDTFFILSLGITFVLLLVLVYHFRKRLNENEDKYEKLLSIVNDIVQKLNEQQIEAQSLTQMTSAILNSHHNNNNEISDNIHYDIDDNDEIDGDTFIGNEEEEEEWVSTVVGIVNEDEEEESGDEQEESGDEEEESGDEEEESGDEEEESGDEEEESGDEEEESGDEEEESGDEEEESGDEEEDEERVKTINITEIEGVDDIDVDELEEVVEPIDEMDVTLDEEPLSLVEPIKVDKTNEIDYLSMTVTDLRKIVKDKQLSSNVSKLKKQELINLLM